MYYTRRVVAIGLFLTGSLVAIGAQPSLAQTAFDLSPQQSGRIHTTRSDAAAALLPADLAYANPGKFTVAISPYAPPTSTYATDTTTVIGTEADIASLVAEKLGLDLQIVPVAWADWPLGVSSGKYDAVISSITVTEERKEKYDFSTYRNDILGFYVKSDSAITSLKEPKDVAGLKLIVGSGTNQERVLLAWDDTNKKTGLKPIEFQYYEDAAAAELAVLSGRADGIFGDNSELSYSAATDGKTKLVGIVSGGWPATAEIGVVTRKGRGLAEAITKALNETITEGSYIKALKRWSLEAAAVDQAKTNPPGVPKS